MTFDTVVFIYLVGLGVCALASIIFAYYDSIEFDDFMTGFLICFALSMFWPMILGVVTIVGVMWSIYKLLNLLFKRIDKA
jgi:hypothetical protein